MEIKNKIIVIIGPTASGKSLFAENLLNDINGVIINADSMQVYQNLSILTAQPTPTAEHRLYGFMPCDMDFSVQKWLELVCKAIDEALSKNITPIVVGGTGMYISALLDGISPIPSISNEIKTQVNELNLDAAYNALNLLDPDHCYHPQDQQRIKRALQVFYATGQSIRNFHHQKTTFYTNFYTIYIKPDRNLLYQNINNRTLDMFDNGVVTEVEYLLNKYDTYPKAIGLHDIQQYLNNTLTVDQTILNIQQKTRNYAKRQLNWFNNKINTVNLVLDKFNKLN